jgi:hypothetical protein
MHGLLSILWIIALVRRNRRARRLRAALRADRVFRDRVNPLEMDEDDVRDRYRFRPPTIRWLCDLLRPDLERPTDCSSAVPVLYVVCIALRFLATSGFLITVGDLPGVSKATACRCVWGFCCRPLPENTTVCHISQGSRCPESARGLLWHSRLVNYKINKL